MQRAVFALQFGSCPFGRPDSPRATWRIVAVAPRREAKRRFILDVQELPENPGVNAGEIIEASDAARNPRAFARI